MLDSVGDLKIQGEDRDECLRGTMESVEFLKVPGQRTLVSGVTEHSWSLWD